MVSLTPKETGVSNTIFVSTAGHAIPAARIKIAIDPPDSFNAASKTATMALHDCSISDDDVPADVAKQASQFIALNRQALLDY